MKIITIRQAQTEATPKGFALLCSDHNIDPKTSSSQERVTVEYSDLIRYGMLETAKALQETIRLGHWSRQMALQHA